MGTCRESVKFSSPRRSPILYTVCGDLHDHVGSDIFHVFSFCGHVTDFRVNDWIHKIFKINGLGNYFCGKITNLYYDFILIYWNRKFSTYFFLNPPCILQTEKKRKKKKKEKEEQKEEVRSCFIRSLVVLYISYVQMGSMSPYQVTFFET